MCALSILFSYKVGLFNIGAAGQYCVGAALSLYAALGLGWSWLPCMLAAILGRRAAGRDLGPSQVLLQRQRGHFRHHAQLDRAVSDQYAPYARKRGRQPPILRFLATPTPPLCCRRSASARCSTRTKYVGLAIPLAVVMAVIVWIVLDKTKFGYELKATGLNKNAAKYCGMAEKRNIILSLMISGALAGMGAAMLYLTSYEQWQCSSSSVPAMGFNGIAAAFLGGLNPIGSIFASFFIQHITAGGAYVDKSMYCAQISDLISALIIYLCGFVLFMKNVMSSIAARREEKAIAKAKALAEAKKGGETE